MIEAQRPNGLKIVPLEKTLPDPTANRAIRNLMEGPQREGHPQYPPTRKQLLTCVQKQLTTLNEKRAGGELTAKQFRALREPFRILLRKLREEEIEGGDRHGRKT